MCIFFARDPGILYHRGHDNRDEDSNPMNQDMGREDSKSGLRSNNRTRTSSDLRNLLSAFYFPWTTEDYDLRNFSI